MTARGYRVARVTLNGITHAVALWMNSRVTACCGQPCGLAEIYEIGVGVVDAPAVSCMSCLVEEART